jgi:hypothetical protein
MLLALLFGAAAIAQEPPTEATIEQPAPTSAAAETASEPTPEAPPAGAAAERVFSLGPLEYRSARGVRFGDTGLTIGGFTTFEIEDVDGEPASVALDALNFLALYEPVESLRFFAELEIGELLSWETNSSDVESSPHANFERLYVEYSASDALNFRAGKFLTPFGHWNLVPAEPFVWTATQPAILEIGLDEHQTGVAIFGSFYPEKRVVNYWIYGQVIDAFDVESDEVPAERTAGGRIEYGEARGAWSFGGSLLGSKLDGAWSTTAGIDAKWRATDRLELSSEALVTRGDIPGRDLWGAFIEASYPLDRLSPKLAKLYLVGRVEHFDLSGARATQIFDLGLTWLPAPWLNLKAGYRAPTHQNPEVRAGLNVSISVLF